MTALFADVVGSTYLGERLAPEEVKAVVGECVSRMSRVVESFGATVGAYMGDGIAAFFGVPATHEDDAQRAAAASLALLADISTYACEVQDAWGIDGFGVRLGVNSGPAAVGAVGAAAPQQVVLGDAVNVAARLQAAAEPGSVLVGERTAEQLWQSFALRPLGEHHLKGRAAGVVAFRLERARTRQMRDRGMSIVGRGPELARISGVLADLRLGRGRVVNVLGEPGIGKTALLRAVHGNGGDLPWLEGTCAPYGQRLYAPFAEMLRSWLGLEGGEPNVVVRTRLRSMVGEEARSDGEPLFAYLSWILGVASPDVDRMAQELGFEAFGAQVKAAYRRWIASLASSEPLILVVENLHWAEPSTRVLAEELLPLIDEVPVVLFATTRKEPESEGWRFVLRTLESYAHRTITIELDGLDDNACTELIELSGGAKSRAVLDAIIERSEGNPLYIEELTRAIGSDGDDPERTKVPPPLHGLLISRLDALPPRSRRLAQIASVAGRSFSIDTLARLLGSSNDIRNDLLPLLRHDLWREADTQRGGGYRFKHWLVRQAAYATLSQRDRANIHAALAEILEENLSAGIDRSRTEIAHHLQRAGALERAVDLLESAGQAAAQAGELDEAIELIDRCRSLLGPSHVRWFALSEFLARLYGRKREFERAVELISEVLLDGCPQSERGRLLGLRAYGLIELGRAAEAFELASEARALCGAGDSRYMLNLALAAAAVDLARYGEALDALTCDFGTDSGRPLEIEAERLDVLVTVAFAIGDLELGAAALEEYEAMPLPAGSLRRISRAIRRACLLNFTGRLSEAESVLVDAQRESEKIRAESLVPMIAAHLTYVYLARGNLRAAADALEELEGVREFRWSIYRAVLEAELASRRGGGPDRSTCLVASREQAHGYGIGELMFLIDVLLAIRSCEAGEPRGRAAAIDTLVRMCRAGMNGTERVRIWIALAGVSLRESCPRRAEMEARFAVLCAERGDRPLASRAWRMVGLAQGQRSAGSGRDALQRSLDLSREMGTRLEEAHTLVAMADAGMTRDRLATLREARDIFEECGADGHLERLERRLASEAEPASKGP